MTGAVVIQKASPRSQYPRDSPPGSLAPTRRLIDVAGGEMNR